MLVNAFVQKPIDNWQFALLMYGAFQIMYLPTQVLSIGLHDGAFRSDVQWTCSRHSKTLNKNKGT